MNYSDIHVVRCNDGIIEVWGLPEFSYTYEIILIIER
jgi:hypothetical protein